MNSNNQHCGKAGLHLRKLVSRIVRLRAKLISYGYSAKEVIDIIFEEFLSLPQIDWTVLQETRIYHDLKSKLRMGSSSAEITLRLQKIVPNLHTVEVCDYLLAMLEVNANLYGFNLDDSSSESNQSGSGAHRLVLRRMQKKPRRKKNEQQQRKKEYEKQKQQQKRVHYDPVYRDLAKKQMEINIFFQSKPKQPDPYSDLDLEKEIKHMPDSEDSDNNNHP